MPSYMANCLLSTGFNKLGFNNYFRVIKYLRVKLSFLYRIIFYVTIKLYVRFVDNFHININILYLINLSANATCYFRELSRATF